MQVQLGLIGYTLSGAFFAVLTVLLLFSWQRHFHYGLLWFACLTTSVWSFVLAWLSVFPGWHSTALPVEYFAELSHSGAWLLVVAVLFRDSSRVEVRSRVQQFAVALSGAALAAMLLTALAVYLRWLRLGDLGILVLNLLLIEILGLLMIEQIYRNAVRSIRPILKFLLLGIGIILGYDLLLFSSSVLTDDFNQVLWNGRGFVFLVSAPMIAVAVRRMPEWSADIFVSRQVVLYSATLIGLGIYLVVLAVTGEIVQAVGGTWGGAAQVALLITGAALVAYFVLSNRRRAQLRVLVDKHFFRNKYDYRSEWLRLAKLLSADSGKMSLRERCISAFANIVDARTGTIWIVSRDGDQYVPSAAWNTELPADPVSNDDALVAFLAATNWVIDINEYRLNPGSYSGLDLDRTAANLTAATFVIPLIHESALSGFVVLGESSRREPLNYEDHDLLKTIGFHVAGHISLESLTDELAESKQFEAFNKLTAFLMHDLKNVVAQQSLVLDNAKDHKHRPEFVDDALSTIANSVARLRNVLDQLSQKLPDLRVSRVSVDKALRSALNACEHRSPCPVLGEVEDVSVLVDGDKFLMVLVSLIRNAQDSIEDGGSVVVSSRHRDGKVTVEIRDDGRGMDEDFIRNRLFRPFDSTKGAAGMGIGAYQAREFARMSGGSLRVDSVPGEGTCVTIELPPMADAAAGQEA